MPSVPTSLLCLSLLVPAQALGGAPAAEPIATDWNTFARTLSTISERLYFQARLDDALRLLDANLAAAPPDLSAAARAQLLYARARTVYYMSSLAGSGYDTALQALDEAWRAAERGSDRRLQADVLDLTGLCHYSREFGRGEYATARPYYDRAFALRTELGDRRGLAESFFHYGLIHQNREHPTKADEAQAREYYQRSLRIAEEDHLQLEQSYALRHLAAFESNAGNLESALEMFERSLALRREIGFLIYLPAASLAVGDVLLEMRRYDEALASYGEALESARAIGAARFIVDAGLAIGDVHKAEGRTREARQAYESALAEARERAYADGAQRAFEKLKRLSGDAARIP